MFFVDAAHFVLGAWLGYLWCRTRVLLPTLSGRQRFNVLGALHAITHEVITVTHDTYITTERVVAPLNKLVQDDVSPLSWNQIANIANSGGIHHVWHSG